MIAALVAALFFAWGVSDGSVSSYNIGIWLAILAAAAGIPAGGAMLRSAGYMVLSALLLLVLAVPATLYGVFILMLLILQPRWH
ncbi:hypothetical protein VQH23_21905 [Pararoseomonas sp. SCSIO 73927]|uniref:hypothetical protein n=1 Tax=Pararoseomonas sp. SCSIO 73927 TaxID=3114537 RepID=UPI0030CB34B2